MNLTDSKIKLFVYARAVHNDVSSSLFEHFSLTNSPKIEKRCVENFQFSTNEETKNKTIPLNLHLFQGNSLFV